MHRLCLWVLCSLALSASLSLAGVEAGDQSDRDAGKLLLMHYMPWYQTPEGRGRYGPHWTGWQKQHNPAENNKQGLPDIWSHYHPLIGPYDSADPDVLECHLLQMKLAGVDGVIVDWYGIGQVYDYPVNQEASLALFDATGRHGMRFAVCYEDRTVESLVNQNKLDASRVGDHLAETLAWLDEHWFGAERYVRVDGRPLLLNFGPIAVKDPSVWDSALSSVSPRPAYFALHHLWKKIGADGGFTWVHSGAWNEEADRDATISRLDRVYSGVSDDPDRVIVSALPGFKDVYEKSHPYLAHRGGDTLEESLAVCMDGPWSTVQLITWNDYGEGTVIEPTHEFGYRFLEIIQDARQAETGGTFASTHADLRLPARLLRLRKAGSVPAETLDRVSSLLADGSCDQARAVLDGLTD